MQKYEITLSVTSFGKTTNITQPDDIDMHQFLDTCRNLAIAAGYHEDSWKDAVIEMANDYLEEEEREVEKNLRDYGGVSYDYLRKTPKVYTGKSNELTHWGPLNPTEC
jgi:hypothetical protein